MTTKKKPYVIVRCSAAGVWAGCLEKKTKDSIVLSKARRLWRWWSIFTLSELALHGPCPDKVNENRYAEALPRMELSGWCEILPCSRKAEKAIKGAKNANQ